MKKEDSKYYTPTLEEFYVGFEYERFISKSNHIEKDYWNIITMSVNFLTLDEIDDEIIKKEIRVKYLDKEDIESCGFEYDNNAEPIPCRADWNVPKTTNYELPLAFLKDTQLINDKGWFLYLYKDNTIWIEYIKDNCDMGYLFKGKIKNKSELKTLLKQLNI